MIKEQTSPFSTAVSLLDMSLSCPKHCKSLRVYNRQHTLPVSNSISGLRTCASALGFPRVPDSKS